MQTIEITDFNQLAEYASKLPEEYDWFKDVRFSFSDDIKGIKMRFQGERFESTLNTSMMRSILDLQKGLYEQYALFMYANKTKRLTLEEKQMLELYVKVEEGSSWIELIPLPIIKAAAERVKKMTGKEIIATIAAVSIGATLCISVPKIIDSHEKRKELEQMAQLIEGVQKTTVEAQIAALNAQTEFYRGVSKQTDSTDITINGEQVTSVQLREIVRKPREKVDIETLSYSGDFIITDIHFKDDAMYLDVVKIDTGKEIKYVNIFGEMISEDDYQWFKDSTNRQTIEMSIATTEKKGKIIGAKLVSFKKQ